MFAGLLAEIRAYGEGLIIAEQIPDRLVQDVIKNTAVKITHRLPAADDREAVGATMNMTQAQNRFLVTLNPGEAAVFTDGMDFPLLTRMPDGTAARRPGRPPGRRPPPPGRGGPAAQHHLRRRLRRPALHAAGHAGGTARAGGVPAGQAVDRAVGPRAPDRLAYAGAAAPRCSRCCR
jgi:Predicted ATPase